MKKRITALATIILILLSNASSLIASGHTQCKTVETQSDSSCEMMEMKMDCCPSTQPLSDKCQCPEMNSKAAQHDANLFMVAKSFETPGKIILQSSTLNHFENTTSKNLHVNFYTPHKPDTKIYKSIHSFLI